MIISSESFIRFGCLLSISPSKLWFACSNIFQLVLFLVEFWLLWLWDRIFASHPSHYYTWLRFPSILPWLSENRDTDSPNQDLYFQLSMKHIHWLYSGLFFGSGAVVMWLSRPRPLFAKCISLDHLVLFWFVNFSEIEREVLVMVLVGCLLVFDFWISCKNWPIVIGC